VVLDVEVVPLDVVEDAATSADVVAIARLADDAATICT
jgi:hypothetical protein